MADLPELKVEIGFSAALTGTALHLGDSSRGILGTATLGTADLFVDVSEYVTNVTTFRGARRADGAIVEYEQGTCTIRFRNDDRRFDPTNLAGPYVAGGATQVEPMRAVRIRATYNGVTWPIWRGFTNQWSVGYDGPNSSWAQVTCFDAFAVFAAHSRGTSAAVGNGETTGARIGRILNGISWPAADRVLDTGLEAVQATTLSGQVLSEMQVTAASEMGELYMDADGRVTFRDRDAAYTDTRSTLAQGSFGDAVTDGDVTVNLVTNPSLEVDTSGGWSTIGTVPPTLSRSNTRAVFGSWSLLATWGTGGLLPGVVYDVVGTVPGRTYTISVYVYVPAGSRPVDLIALSQWGSGTGSTTDQWVRLTWTGTAAATTLGVALWPSGSPTAGEQVWIDGLQVEEGPEASTYVDGDQAGGEWDGVAHASTSRRLPELPAADVELAYDVSSIFNHIAATRNGGTEQTAINGASQTAYLTRSYSRSDLILQTDSEVLLWAEQIVARTAQPELRIASITLKPTRDVRLWAQAFGREIGDRVRGTKRPPGGGDPIVREGLVRGIEHELPVEQDWKTTLVLEQARDVEVTRATFGTTASNGWGNADNGAPWTTSGGAAADYSVSGGLGRHALTSTGVGRSSYLTMGGANQFVQIDATVAVLPAGGAITVWLLGRVTDLNNYYSAQISIGTTGAVTLNLFKRVAGALSSLGSVAAGTHAAGNTWRIQLGVEGTRVQGRAWRPATDPTPGWTSTTDASLTAGSQAGVQSRRETGNTNSTTVTFDDFYASTQHWWV